MMIYPSLFLAIAIFSLVLATIVRIRIFNRPYFGKEFSEQPDKVSSFSPTKIMSRELPVKSLTEKWLENPLLKLFTSDTPSKKLRKTYAHLYIPPTATKDNPASMVVYVHGNGATIEEAMAWLEFIYKDGFAVLLPEYRGFGNSGGHPGAKAIQDDLCHFYDESIKNNRIDKKNVCFYARSLGGGIACNLATTKPPKKLILESTYTNIHSVVDKWYVPSFLMWDCDFKTTKFLTGYQGQTLICHGSNDATIKPWHAKKNLRAAHKATLKLFDATHADIYRKEEYQKEVLSFLRI